MRRKGLLVPVTERHAAARRRGQSRRAHVRFRTVGDMTCTCPVESPAANAAEVVAETLHGRRQRARRHPHGRPHLRSVDGAAQEGRVFLMSAVLQPPPRRDRARPPRRLRFLTAGSVDDGKSTLIGRLLFDSRPILADQLDALQRAAANRSTCRCSPTASRPSANRASRSTWPTATSPPAAASSSSPTRRATSSTRATWSRPPPAATPPWCWSTSTKLALAQPRSRRNCCRRRAAMRCWRNLLRVPSHRVRGQQARRRGRRRRSPSTPSARRSTHFAAAAGIARRGHRAGLGAARATTWSTRQPRLVRLRGPVAAAAARKLAVTAAGDARGTSPSRCSGSRSSPRRPTPARAAACSGAASPRAHRAGPAASRCCPAARPRRWPRC